MEYGAIDLHKKECQIRIVTEGGEVLLDRRITTARDRLTAVFEQRPRLRILIEASTGSEWVAQHLERLGHEVIVADPNYAPMYGSRTRRVKTDRRDVAALAEACRRGLYHPAHRRSTRQRTMQDDPRARVSSCGANATTSRRRPAASSYLCQFSRDSKPVACTIGGQ
jgi:transposase